MCRLGLRAAPAEAEECGPCLQVWEQAGISPALRIPGGKVPVTATAFTVHPPIEGSHLTCGGFSVFVILLLLLFFSAGWR